MVLNSKVKVKLNEKGWEIYKSKNGFAESNVDNQGYSTFSYDYFEELFYPLPFAEFADDVIGIKKQEESIND